MTHCALPVVGCWLLVAGCWSLALHTISYSLEFITHSIPLDEGVMQHAALVFSEFAIHHLAPLGQPLEQRSTSVVVKRLGSKDAEAVKLPAPPSVAEHADSPHGALDGISHSAQRH